MVSGNLSAKEVLKDKVYLRIEDDYYSGWELNKVNHQIEYFYCLYPESMALDALKKYFEANMKKEYTYQNILSIEVSEQFVKDERSAFYVSFLKLFRFLKAQNVSLTPQLLKNIKDQISLTGCKLDSKFIPKAEDSVKPFYQLEVFLKSRFNLESQRSGKTNYQSAFTFFSSLDKQYRHEYFK